MRIFDALNDVDNIKASVKYIKKYGGMADCAVCYTVDPKYDEVDEPETEKKKRDFCQDYLGRRKNQRKNRHMNRSSPINIF